MKNEFKTGASWVTLGAFLAAASVVAGAFGAHALDSVIRDIVEDPEKSMQNWETAARYQMYHAIGIILIGFCFAVFDKKTEFRLAGYCFVVGIVVFSGLLFVLSVTDLKFLGAIVPIGGLAMILGWVLMAVGAIKICRTR